MTPEQAAMCAVEDGREALQALHALVREATTLVAQARAAELEARSRELEARRRADDLSQILQGATGLADAVLAGDHDDARLLAALVIDRIGALTP
jgi:hypothetical protein